MLSNLFMCGLYYGSLILVFPILGLLYRSHQYALPVLRQTMFHPIVSSACYITLFSGFIAAMINCLMGILISWILVQLRFPGKRMLDIAVDLPLALPTSVGGLTLMTVYSDQGWMGALCQFLGIRVAFTRLGVIVAMIFVSLPFIIRTVQPVLANLEHDIEEASWCLGASPWITFWWVICPALSSSLLTGATLAFSRAIAEYGSIVLVASNIPRNDLVVSVLIFQRLEQYDYQGAISIAVIMLGISFSIVLTTNTILISQQNKKHHS